MTEQKNLTEKLIKEHRLTQEEYLALLKHRDEPEVKDPLREEALRLRKEAYGTDVYIRGLIEFTNICRNDCCYCGIRKSNPNLARYRLTEEEIYACCKLGYDLGFRTFVLQGGEDPFFSDEVLCPIVREIKVRYPDCALTLSVGERSRESYRLLKEAGADRYLLRHETADAGHYRMLHPESQDLRDRIRCLYDLKDLGYQVGAGFMVGSPHQTDMHLAEDLVFLQDMEPEMVGIGPFIPHHDTPFAKYPAGSVELTLFLLSVIRIILPGALLPATTALGTTDSRGREKGMLAGANVVMPNLSPEHNRSLYSLYDNKIGMTGDTKHNLESLKESMASAGFTIVCGRGDHINF